MPDLKRLGLPLDASALSMTHANNTLVITVRAGPPTTVVRDVASPRRLASLRCPLA